MTTGDKPRIEMIHTARNDPSYNLPYAPAIVVNGGRLLFTAAMAAPTYHHHRHRPSSCTVEVVRLATDLRLKFEMSVIAALPE